MADPILTNQPIERVEHTPGPWETQERDDRERGIAVIAVHPWVPSGGTPTRGMVAWVGQGGANFGKPAVQEANARLIAAAPDLLDALRAFCGDHEATGHMCEGLNTAYQHALAVIAKAEGK